jgi:mannose-6-phosphate isomerase
LEWYPIKLTAHIRPYTFGGRLIPDLLGKQGLPEGVVAETWEVSDYQDTTGTVINGHLAGRTLHDLVVNFPDELIGQGWHAPHFPLLLKFLDASHMLPVHLHADDETARRVYAEPNGKTEAWHVLWAEPGATILAGVEPGVSRAELFRAFKNQAYDAVMPRYSIQSGDTVYVPGGVIHSFGPGTLIFEVQQTSNLGQSVMPNDGNGNALPVEVWEANINAALDELRIDYQPCPTAGLFREHGVNRYTVCCAGPHFALERWSLTEPHVEPSHPQRFLTLSNVGDTIRICYGDHEELVARGESCILPAAIAEARIVPAGTADLIVCYVPDLQRDVVEPLRRAGHSDAAIRSLGEIPAEALTARRIEA